jgi:hypothetical protein
VLISWAIDALSRQRHFLGLQQRRLRFFIVRI